MQQSLLADASRRRYTLLAISCFNLETARATIRVAEQQRALVILNLYQDHCGHLPLVRALADETAVSVTLSLEHGSDAAIIGQAFRAGFSGLVIDASSQPLAENICQTHKVVQLAAPDGVCVEGELGHIANARQMMTAVKDVEPFLCQTGIDLLAVSVGTAHGLYPLIRWALRRRWILSGWRPSIGYRACRSRYTTGCASVSLCRTGGSLTDLLRLMESACQEVVAEYFGWSGSAHKA